MYKFTRIDDDTTELEYNGEKFTIVKDLEKAVQLQQVDFEARVLLNKKLKEMGVSIEDLQYEKVEGGKKVIDDSQVQKLLDDCKQMATYNKMKQLVKDITGKNLLDLAIELGKDDYEKFMVEIGKAIVGTSDKTPSK